VLKTRLHEVGGPSDSDSSDEEDARPAREESICMDMDFAENSDIVHKVKVQSEHWSHQQSDAVHRCHPFQARGLVEVCS